MADAMTECIRVLVARGVVRTEQLELLLVIAGEPERGWPTRAIVDGVAQSAAHADLVLRGLAGRGLLSVTLDDAVEATYRLDSRLDVGALQALRTTFLRDRARVTDALERGGAAEVRDPIAWRSI